MDSLFAVIVLTFVLVSNAVPLSPDVLQCSLPTTKLRYFQILPGLGWDNLQNVQMARIARIVYNTSSTSCENILLADDLGEEVGFLLPKGVYLQPARESTVQLDSDLIDHYSNYTSITARSINTDQSFVTPGYQISGSFSWEKQQIKNDQLSSKSSTNRVQLRYHLFTVFLDPSLELHSTFRDRLLDLAAQVTAKNRQQASYLADLIVRDYGTHIVSSVSTGGTLVKIDQISTAYVEKTKSQLSALRAAASASFYSKLNVNAKFSQNINKTLIDEYNANTLHSQINSIGGPAYLPTDSFSVTDWVAGLANKMVAIDRSGEPLHFVITPRSLPHLSEDLVYKVAQFVKEAVDRYYSANILKGCMDITSPNFNSRANIDSGDCLPSKTNFTLGGVFQNCSEEKPADFCQDIVQKNPATGDFSCPHGYQVAPLQKAQYRCKEVCHTFSRITPRQCRSFCSEYSTYWCAKLHHHHNSTTPSPDAPPRNRTDHSKMKENGFLFGGLFTKSTPNPVTKDFNCPPTYVPIKMGIEIIICLGQDLELGGRHLLPFGGFFSCFHGNPLVSGHKNTQSSETWPRHCPQGYTQHLAGIDQDCQIDFCVRANVLAEHVGLLLRRPPFVSPLAPNWTSIVAPSANQLQAGPYGQKWGRTPEGDAWMLHTSIDNSFMKIVPDNFSDSTTATPSSNNSSQMPIGLDDNSVPIILVSVFATLCSCALIIILSCLIIRWRNRPYSGYRPI